MLLGSGAKCCFVSALGFGKPTLEIVLRRDERRVLPGSDAV